MTNLLALIFALTAYATPQGAIITWHQPAGFSCLYRNGTVMLDCAERAAGQHTIELAPTQSRDAAYVPRPGDTYQVVMDGEFVSTRLVYRVFLPITLSP